MKTVRITVSAVNDAPAVELTGDNSANEGDAKDYTYTAGDPDGGPAPTITEGCGENGVLIETEQADHFQCRFPDGPADSTVTVGAKDADETGSDEIAVEVANVAPRIALTGLAQVNEGDTETYSFEVNDPGDDTHTMTTACGTNGKEVENSYAYDAAAKKGSFECSFPSGPAATDVTAKATDSDGASDTDDQRVTVAVDNVAPTGALNAPESVSEGQNVEVSLTNVEDPNSSDAFTYRFKCGEAAWGEYGESSSASCPTAGSSAVVVKGQVKDDDGGESPEYEATVKVNNVAPETSINSGPEGATSNNKPSFTFSGSDDKTAEADLLFSHKLDGGDWSEYSAQKSVTLGGDAGLPDGPHTFQVRAKDQAGNVDGDPAKREFTVDATAPETQIAASSGPTGTVNTGAASFDFSSTEQGASFRCKLDNGSYEPASPL